MATEKNRHPSTDSKERTGRQEPASQSSSRREADLASNRGSSSGSHQRPSGNADRKQSGHK